MHLPMHLQMHLHPLLLILLLMHPPSILAMMVRMDVTPGLEGYVPLLIAIQMDGHASATLQVDMSALLGVHHRILGIRAA